MALTLPLAGAPDLRPDPAAPPTGGPDRLLGPEGLENAERAFRAQFPDFDPHGTLAQLRRREFARLDATGQIYLDYTGGSLPAASQIRAHADLLQRCVLGNPHSANPTSAKATALAEEARHAVLRFLNAPEDEYLCAFTANATGALRLVGEAYRFEPGGTLALTIDNHNSVNGIRQFARRRGAAVSYVPVTAPELRVDRAAMTRVLGSGPRHRRNLMAFPAQSNFSGVQHPLDLVDQAHDAGWDVLVDASAFVPTNRLDLSMVHPDFVALSLYKIIGYPTGIGALVVRRDRLGTLERPWFSGGTVTVASVQGDGHYLAPGPAGFEDGTVDYLNLPAVTTGLRFLEDIGRDALHRRVECLTLWLLDAMTGLRHSGGGPVIEIHGPSDGTDRGGTIAFLVRDRTGAVVDEARVEERAGRAGISLRTGCFCNPGAGEAAFGLGPAEMAPWFGRPEPVTPSELREGIRRRHGRVAAAVRISVGVATTFADVHHFIRFLRTFIDHEEHTP